MLTNEGVREDVKSFFLVVVVANMVPTACDGADAVVVVVPVWVFVSGVVVPYGWWWRVPAPGPEPKRLRF